jgi:hypothetical protein
MPNFFYLPKQHPQTLESLPNGRFYTKDNSNIVQDPHGCAPVWCEYNGNWTNECHYWENPISGRVHTTHPLGLTTSDSSFFDGFYEITQIEGLTFREGEAWCLKTNQMVRVEKTDQTSIWIPFFQEYDQPCDRNEHDCESHRSKYDFSKNRFHEFFSDDMNEFFKYYCRCCRCQKCLEIHLWDCIGVSSRTKDF